MHELWMVLHVYCAYVTYIYADEYNKFLTCSIHNWVGYTQKVYWFDPKRKNVINYAPKKAVVLSDLSCSWFGIGSLDRSIQQQWGIYELASGPSKGSLTYCHRTCYWWHWNKCAKIPSSHSWLLVCVLHCRERLDSKSEEDSTFFLFVPFNNSPNMWLAKYCHTMY